MSNCLSLIEGLIQFTLFRQNVNLLDLLVRTRVKRTTNLLSSSSQYANPNTLGMHPTISLVPSSLLLDIESTWNHINTTFIIFLHVLCTKLICWYSLFCIFSHHIILFHFIYNFYWRYVFLIWVHTLSRNLEIIFF